MDNALSSDAAIDLLSGFDDGEPAVGEVETEDADDGAEEIVEDNNEDLAADDVQSDAEDLDGPDDEATEEDDDVDAEVEPEPAIDAPTFLDATEKEAFKSLPTEAQQIIARQSALVQADYTRKSQELAAQRKDYETRIERIGEVMTEREQRLQEWNNVDWVAYAQQSPEEAQVARAQFEKEQREYQQLSQQRQQAEQTALNQHLTEQRERLKTELPDMLDPVKGKEISQKVMAELTRTGRTAEQVKWISADEIAYIYDALRYRELKAKQGQIKPKSAAKTTSKALKSKSRPQSSKQAPKGVQKFNNAPTRGNAMAALMDFDD